MFCSKCGFKLDNSANFCGNCGAPISAEQKQAVQAFNTATKEQQPTVEKPLETVAEGQQITAEQPSETVTEAPKSEVDEFFTPPPVQPTAWGGQPYSAPARTCPYCKSEVSGGATYCPTCKSFVAMQPTAEQKEQMANKRNTFSLLSFIISLASIFLGAIAGGIVGIIFGAKAVGQIKRGKGTGKAMAIWGIIFGVVAIIVSIIMIVIGVLLEMGYLDYATTYPIFRGEVI